MIIINLERISVARNIEIHNFNADYVVIISTQRCHRDFTETDTPHSALPKALPLALRIGRGRPRCSRDSIACLGVGNARH
jgi:hypothetical protein